MPKVEPRVAVEIKNLSCNYANTTKGSISDISLKIPEKSVFAIIGPSGCGKSTLLRTINRMNDLYEGFVATGEIIIDGNNILEPSTDLQNLRTKVGMIFQKPTVFPMSIFENIAFGLRAHGNHNEIEITQVVEGSLRKAALWEEVKDKLKAPATGLSGGQQQRLCIARTIALRPDIILMDEPTSALDPISTAKIEQLILELRDFFTIIVVSHSMHQTQRISDNVLFMMSGKIEEMGSTKKVFSFPQKQTTKNYITGRELI